MNELRRGLYETLLDRRLQRRLGELEGDLVAEYGTIDSAEAADRFALHVQRLVRRVLASSGEGQRVELGARVARRIIALLADLSESAGVDDDDRLVGDGEVLRALLEHLPDGNAAAIDAPATPLLDTTLLTNAPGEPRLLHQLRSEVDSADRIDVLMAFVRRSGIRPLLEALRRHGESGRRLRVLTTTYTQSTELAALEQLQELGADIRVSYDASGTRLHAKAWMFHRASGYSTAYIGSSNLTRSAQVTGLEWNVRLSGARNPDVIDKFDAVFESHWQSDNFRPLDVAEFRAAERAHSSSHVLALSPVELRPEAFQERLLEKIALARRQGHHRNLLVAATGTGKTVMAALDYQRLRECLPRARLLFVAHRREILDQSLATFRHALRDAAFGERWVGGVRPERFDHVFASVQSLAATDLQHLAPDHFDVVIVDEFHHAAARTYDTLLKHLAPRELLGLTATPERTDGRSVLPWFDGRMAAELRIWDAIEQQFLCPFAYYGISDGLDLRRVGWRRGQGYDRRELDNVVSGNQVLARLVIQQCAAHVDNLEAMRALGFCVSVGHARFMADAFNQAGVAAAAVAASTPADERRAALAQLKEGTLRVIFAVDLFNEGVDLPAVDTLLLLRPTDSATIFLQQLGRGLRKQAGKPLCTVLDFVSLHRREFRFGNRFGALLGGTRRQLMDQVRHGFPWLPSGCHMELDALASKVVLQNLKDSVPSTRHARVLELEQVAAQMGRPRLKQFLAESGLRLEDVYAGNHGWSDLLQDAGFELPPAGPQETSLRRALGRLLHVDDELRIHAYAGWATQGEAPATSAMTAVQRRLFHMLTVSLFGRRDMHGLTSLADAAQRLWQHPQVLAELDELMEVLADRVEHLSTALAKPCSTPLQIHARYTRREILAALAEGDALAIGDWREGVRWLAERRTDVAVFTLDKSDRHFSPTTRYRDYAINRRIIHWESQSTVRADSPTGRRYQGHHGGEDTFLLFARLRNDERAFWLLGPATYQTHEGERPMAIQWRLAYPLPGDLYAEFAAAV